MFFKKKTHTHTHTRARAQIVYITRNDAAIRRVSDEAKLIRSIKTTINKLASSPSPVNTDVSRVEEEEEEEDKNNDDEKNNDAETDDENDEGAESLVVAAFRPILPDYSLSPHRIRKCNIKSVMLEGLPLKDTIKIFQEVLLQKLIV
jgi:hypothetical protein